MRITEKDLQSVVDRLNLITNSPAKPYTKGPDGKYTANIGCFHISYAYGGAALHRMHNSGGGVEDVLSSGHVPKRELYERVQAYIKGIGDANNRLIDAAPELLAFLKRHQKSFNNFFDGLEGAYSDSKRDLNDLIKKAEGKEE